MASTAVSQRAQRILNAGSARLVEHYFVNTYQQSVRTKSDIADFTFGNPHEMPLQGVVGLLTAPPPRSRPGANDYLGFVDAAARAGIPTVVSARRSQWPGLIRMIKPDLCCSAGFVWKIPPDAFPIPP